MFRPSCRGLQDALHKPPGTLRSAHHGRSGARPRRGRWHPYFLFRTRQDWGGIPVTVLHSCSRPSWYKKYSVSRQYFIDLRENVAGIFVKLESRGFIEKLLLKNAGQQQFCC